MALIVAASGLSGAGKTSAIRFFNGLDNSNSCEVYLGSFIISEVRARGLPDGPDSERRVRMALRSDYGSGYLVMLASEAINASLNHQKTVLIDAVFTPAELEQLKQFCDRVMVVAIDAPFDVRAVRVQLRKERPLTLSELQARDKVELEELKLEEVMRSATVRLENAGTMESFERSLKRFWERYVIK